MKKTEITKEMTLSRDNWLKHISELTGIPCLDVMGRNRKTSIVIARHLLAWALYRLESYTLSEVGALLGRNHATIYHSVLEVDNLQATSKLYAPIISAMVHFCPKGKRN